MNKLVISFVAVAGCVGLAVPAMAQPRPDAHEHHEAAAEHRDAVAEHNAAAAEHRDAVAEHNAAVAEHREAVAIHRETEEEIRVRMLREQHDEFARRQAERRNQALWEAHREERAIAARNQLQSTWGSSLNRPEARAELALHADRMARLNRILDIAQDRHDAALIARTEAVLQREINRDARILHAIRVKVEGQ
ncbi:MAG TPA: hypothetical protein VGM44_22530 [Polyangiaceae bacterium]